MLIGESTHGRLADCTVAHCVTKVSVNLAAFWYHKGRLCDWLD